MTLLRNFYTYIYIYKHQADVVENTLYCSDYVQTHIMHVTSLHSINVYFPSNCSLYYCIKAPILRNSTAGYLMQKPKQQSTLP